MLKSRKKMLVLSLFLPAAITARATGGYEQLLQQIVQNNKGTEMSYRYSVALRDLEKGILLDSMNGSMYASGVRYLDSNSRTLSLRSDQYFCKLAFKERTAEVYSTEQMRARLGGALPDQPQGLFAMSPELFKAYSRIIVDSSTDKRHYRIRVLLQVQEMPEVTLVVRRADYRLSSMVLELRDKGEERFRRIVRLYDIRRSVPAETFRTGHLFTATGNKVLLQGKYSKYKLLPSGR